jgi:hypothetical protein
LHKLLLVHAVEKVLQLGVPQVAEVQAGRYTAGSGSPPTK